MVKYKIDNTDIILEDFEKDGQGKIIIADSYRRAFTYTWGSMGENIKEFIKRINPEYFCDKLIPDSCYVFSGKRSAKNVRRYVREEMRGDMPWYKFMSAQKEIREKIKELEFCDNENEFVYMMSHMTDNLCCYDLDYKDEKEFIDIIKSHFTCEPWHFIGEELSNTYKWLYELHGKLVKELNK